MSRDVDDSDPDRHADTRDPDNLPRDADGLADALGLTAAALKGRVFEAPPRSLRDRIMSMAGALPFSFILREEGIWLPSPDAPVAVKELYRDSGDRLTTRLIRARGGESLPQVPLGGRRRWYVVGGAIASPSWSEPCTSGDAVIDADTSLVATAVDDAVVLEFTRGDAAVGGEWHGPASGDVVRAGAHDWLPYAAGIEVLPIAHGGRDSLVALRLTTGASLDDHKHDGVEELFVLSGSCVVERRPLRAGDYHRANAGSEHAQTESGDEGCLLLVSLRPF